MLHIVLKASATKPLLQKCLAGLEPGDAVVLMNDAVSDAERSSPMAGNIQKYLKLGYRITALQEHASKHSADKLLPELKLISYAEFVQLVAEHEHSRSWF